MCLDAFLEAQRDVMIADLQALIQIPSFRGPAIAGAPFGAGPRDALRFVLRRGEELGLTSTNVLDVAGHLEIGQGEEIVGVLAHCDTVPPGDGWSVDPFGGEVRADRIYGRGACDDKGPLIASLYAFLAVARSGQPLKRRVRLIIGSDEESTWDCVKTYFQHQPQPTLGFTPDGDFPLVVGEKGALLLRFEGPGDPSLTVRGGDAPNVVPALCDVHFAEGGEHRFFGIAAHASVPSAGDNAIVKALRAMEGWGRLPQHGLLPFARHYLDDAYGTSAGIAASDPLLGDLTLNLGRLQLDGDGGFMEADLRFPRGVVAERIVERMQRLAAPFGLSVTIGDLLQPHVVDPASDLVQTLLSCYRARSDDQNSSLVTFGGVTYARAMGKEAVAFGPVRPGHWYPVHQADEYFTVDDLMFAAKVYADAIVRLAA